MKIALILTKYQLHVLIAAVGIDNLKKFIIVTPSNMKHIFEGIEDKANIELVNIDPGYVTFKSSRLIIKKTKEMANKDFFNFKEFWVANDFYPFAQCMKSVFKFKNIVLLEDGLGTYIKQKPFSAHRGLFAIIRQLKLLVYFFPYYRAIYSASGNFKAQVGYAYNKNAFPMHSNIEVIKITPNYKKAKLKKPAPDKATIFIGQPLVNMRMMKKSKYLSIVLRLKSMSKGAFIYKRHPAETDCTWLERAGIEVDRQDNIPVEEYVVSSGQSLSVYGFVSTSMMHIVDFENVDNVVSLKLGSNSLKQYHKALEHLGVHVKDVETLEENIE